MNSESFADSIKKGALPSILPIDLHLQVAMAAVARVGPLCTEVQHLTNEIQEMETAVSHSSRNIDTLYSSTLQVQLRTKKEDLKHANKQLEGSLKNLDRTELFVSTAISGQLNLDRLAYGQVMQKMHSAEPGTLGRLNLRVEELMNHGPLAVGDVVEIRIDGDKEGKFSVDCHPDEGKMWPAKIVRKTGNDKYEVSLRTVLDYISMPYEEGFATRELRKAVISRSKIYGHKKAD
jgi:hypothetical protein